MNREQLEIELMKRGFKFDDATSLWKDGKHSIEINASEEKHSPQLWAMVLRDIDTALAGGDIS